MSRRKKEGRKEGEKEAQADLVAARKKKDEGGELNVEEIKILAKYAKLTPALPLPPPCLSDLT